MKHYIFTEKAFENFSKGIDEWMGRFGMSEWDYSICHEQIGDRKMACTEYNSVTKKALFQLTKSVEFDFGLETDMRKLALHEVLHLALSDYGWTIAQAKTDLDDLALGREHELINRLMRVLLES